MSIKKSDFIFSEILIIYIFVQGIAKIASGRPVAHTIRSPMKIELHHINLCSKDVPGLDKFYRDVLDLKNIQDDEHEQDTDNGYDGGVSFLSDDNVEFHLATTDLGVGHRTGHAVNPLERGHIAFRTDDIEAFKDRLNALNIPFSDYGTWAMAGWYQVFFQDPEGTIIEVHQIGC